MSTPLNIIIKQPFLAVFLALFLFLAVVYIKSAIQSYYWRRYLDKPWWRRRKTDMRQKVAWNWPDD